MYIHVDAHRQEPSEIRTPRYSVYQTRITPHRYYDIRKPLYIADSINYYYLIYIIIIVTLFSLYPILKSNNQCFQSINIHLWTISETQINTALQKCLPQATIMYMYLQLHVYQVISFIIHVYPKVFKTMIQLLAY